MSGQAQESGLARVVIADDHPLFRGALRSAVAAAAPGRPIEERETLSGALEALAEAPAGLLCLDLHMPDSEGLAGLLSVRADYPAVPVMVVSGDTASHVPSRAVALGASGFVPKAASLEEIRSAVEAVLDGEVWLPRDMAETEEDEADTRLRSLTPTQLRVLLHVRDGLLNKQIAYEMDIAEATVKAHLTATFQKLGVQTRTQAALAARALAVRVPEPSPKGRSEDARTTP